MSIYSIDKLINETRRLAAEFKRTTGTMLPVSGEIARYDVSHHLNMTLLNSNNSYDALGNGKNKGLKVLIKSRVIGQSVKSAHRIGQLNLEGEWDIIILSLMNDAFEPIEMYQLERKEIIKTLTSPNKKRGKRGAISVAKFRAIGSLVWSIDKAQAYSIKECNENRSDIQFKYQNR